MSARFEILTLVISGVIVKTVIMKLNGNKGNILSLPKDYPIIIKIILKCKLLNYKMKENFKKICLNVT